MRGLLAQQVSEPLDEQRRRDGIPVLTGLDGDVSSRVRQQYEDNPYPRWERLPRTESPIAIDDYLRRRFPSAAFTPLGGTDGIDVLVAGCGTGQQAIDTAQALRGARVLAVDLSRASLGYAMRKTAEQGLTNIEYAQADITRLAVLGRTFDVVEAVGVLHHLADPAAGWRGLLALLRPAGLMRVGLYSARAREVIAAARSYVAESGYAPTAIDIRRCRQDLTSPAQGARFGQLASLSDFYGTSGCRDLLFHVQEQCFTLPRIKALLDELNLDLIGFMLEAGVLSAYRRRFPADTRATDLDCWERFETDHPATFVGMYEFFVQKRG